MDENEEDIIGEDGFKINDDGDMDEPLEEKTDFGLDEEDPDKDR